jgi:hypothetical protein
MSSEVEAETSALGPLGQTIWSNIDEHWKSTEMGKEQLFPEIRRMYVGALIQNYLTLCRIGESQADGEEQELQERGVDSGGY